ncbi:hypothetical protein DYQ93_19500 [Xanthomonas sp. LMG 8992]|uniref:hypothetical protein n=1 Tax=Xanthomonas sp. LMG 8992 TaxID=1591157 RepID=UPI00136FE4C0|nr:hypothetical protein [Xanthomonas sp. LMG 8992]MXV13194.1 hypothetical protein [Xanthomonas sp. LMG 8992]
MTETPDPKTQALYDMTRQWLGRDLSEAERAQLRAFAAAAEGTQQTADPAPHPAAPTHAAEIERTRQRIDAARRSAEDTMQQGDQAIRDAMAAAAQQEAVRSHVLPSVNTSRNAPIGQDADHLSEVVRREGQDGFDRHFDTFAQQLQAMIQALQAQAKDEVAAASEPPAAHDPTSPPKPTGAD